MVCSPFSQNLWEKVYTRFLKAVLNYVLQKADLETKGFLWEIIPRSTGWKGGLGKEDRTGMKPVGGDGK